MQGDCDLLLGCKCYPGWVGADCSVRDTSCGVASIDHVDPPSGNAVSVATIVSVTGECLARATGTTGWRLDEVYNPSFDCSFMSVKGKEYRFPAVQVGDRGLQCPLPERLVRNAYSNSSSCDPHPVIGVAFKLKVAGGRDGEDIAIAANYTLNHCARDRDCGGGVCGPDGRCLCDFSRCGALCDVPANSTGTCLPTNKAMSVYSVISLGNFLTSEGSLVQGGLLVFGNAALAEYSVGSGLDAPAASYDLSSSSEVTPLRPDRNDLVVCGNLTFLSGAVLGGGNLVYVGGGSRVSRVSVDPPGQLVAATKCPFDRLMVQTWLQSMSLGLAGLPRTGTAMVQYTALQLVGTRVDVNTFQISASDLLTATDIILKLPAFEAAVNASLQAHRTLPTTSVIINVLYENDYTGYGPDPNKTVASARKPVVSLFLNAFGMGGLFAEKASSPYYVLPNIVWNFPSAKSIVMARVGFRGSILAPNAAFNFVSGETAGALWVGSFTGNGAVRMPILEKYCYPPSLQEMAAAKLGEGLYGEPARPDCYPHGFMNPNYTCSCWDETIYKGPTCKESCVQYCSGRGVCKPGNKTLCDCWDPVRWSGDRCEISACGPHGIVIGGDYTVGQAGPVVCGCAPGWTGPTCSVQQSCVWGTFLNSDPPKCLCHPGFSGPQCDIPIPVPLLCQFGVAVTTVSGAIKCQCQPGWSGDHCSVSLTKKCYRGVYNEEHKFCHCDPLWAGESCDIFTCMHGSVVQSGKDHDGAPTFSCHCDINWTGADCNTHCRAACNNHGTICYEDTSANNTSAGVKPVVTTLGACRCDEGYSGTQCGTYAMPTPGAVSDSGHRVSNILLPFGSSNSSKTSSEALGLAVAMKDAVWRDTDVRVVSGMATETQDACSEDVDAGDTLVTQYCLPVAVVMAPSAAAVRRMSEVGAAGTEVASGGSDPDTMVTLTITLPASALVLAANDPYAFFALKSIAPSSTSTSADGSQTTATKATSSGNCGSSTTSSFDSATGVLTTSTCGYGTYSVRVVRPANAPVVGSQGSGQSPSVNIASTAGLAAGALACVAAVVLAAVYVRHRAKSSASKSSASKSRQTRNRIVPVHGTGKAEEDSNPSKVAPKHREGSEQNSDDGSTTTRPAESTRVTESARPESSAGDRVKSVGLTRAPSSTRHLDPATVSRPSSAQESPRAALMRAASVHSLRDTGERQNPGQSSARNLRLVTSFRVQRPEEASVDTVEAAATAEAILNNEALMALAHGSPTAPPSPIITHATEAPSSPVQRRAEARQQKLTPLARRPMAERSTFSPVAARSPTKPGSLVTSADDSDVQRLKMGEGARVRSPAGHPAWTLFEEMAQADDTARRVGTPTGARVVEETTTAATAAAPLQ